MSFISFSVDWNESNYDECVRHPNVKIDEDIGTAPLSKKQVKPKNSSVGDHLLFFNHSTSYDGFSILNRENKKILVELKESLLIMRDQPSLKKEHYVGIITCIRQAQVIRSLLELYLFSLVAASLSAKVHDNGTVQFTFFLVVRLNLYHCHERYSLFVIFLP